MSTIVVNVVVSGTSIINDCSDIAISKAVGRIYDVATFTASDSILPYLGKSVAVTLGSIQFSGIIYSISRTGRAKHRVECRSDSCKTMEPFSDYKYVFEDDETASSLLSTYATEIGVPIVYGCSDLDFGGGYERSGTINSAISNIVNVLGAEVWFDGTSIQIQPNKPISDTGGIVIEDTEYFDFVYESNSVYNKSVGKVIVTNGGAVAADDNIISENKLYCEIDECNGGISVFPNPFSYFSEQPNVVKGATLSDTVKLKAMNQTFSVIDEYSVTLNGAVAQVSSVTLNGVPFTNYQTLDGVAIMYFDAPVRGILVVKYFAYALLGACHIQRTTDGRFISIEMTFKDQILIFFNYLNDCNNDGSGADGTTSTPDGLMYCILPDELIYPKGFYVWTIGGSPEFHFYDKGEEIVRAVTSESAVYTSRETASLSYDEGSYYYRTKYPVLNALTARSSGNDVSYTMDIAGDVYSFVFDAYHPNIIVTYETNATKHFVRFDDIPGGEIVMAVINTDTGGFCETDLVGLNPDDINAIPCELPAIVPIDIVGVLSVPLSDIRGATITVVDPVDSPTNYTIDDQGFIRVHVDQNGDYTADTSGIKNRTQITLRVNV